MAPSTRAGGNALARLTSVRGLLYGGDYAPEQWPAETWREDAQLMVAAGVNLVTVNVFGWSRIEPAEGERDFAWLDEVLDVLHEWGIAVDLATPTASPPPWLASRYPETRPVTADGVRLWHGSRNHFCPTSVVYRDRARRIATDLAARYADHPAVVLWHVGNEFGQVCWCDGCAARFRTWLTTRYRDLEGLNEAWGTAFWGQRYSSWEQVVPPRAAPYLPNPGTDLDFRRFTSDMLLQLYTEQRDAIRGAGAAQPITTNFMGFFPGLDPTTWVGELDVVSDDSYPDPADPEAPVRAALTHDLMRSLADGGPWLLMEQAVSAVNWREHNLPKTAEQMRSDALRAIAHGSDGVLSFQWRASASGAERFHSAMLPHAGTDTRVHRAVRALGADLRALAPLAGTPITARIALLFDWPSWWTATRRGLPTSRLDPLEQLLAWYRPLWRAGYAVDIVTGEADLTGYALLLAPTLHTVTDRALTNLRSAVGTGVLALGPFTAVADPNGAVRPAPLPAGLADLLGAQVEEWCPLGPDGARLTARGAGTGLRGHAHTFAERLRPHGATVLATFTGADLDGCPAVLRAPGADLFHLGAVVDEETMTTWIGLLTGAAGLAPPESPVTGPAALETARRGDHLFLFNPGSTPVTTTLTHPCTDALTGAERAGELTVPAAGAVVLKET
ncbi:beta-galactosidase [Ruania albidiflava]|uniref:beta-galactosidase n=1 Tax=Ruania albidiflava TaxID=366586 RepID=UPI0003B30ACB|nr:beta-galactosidase [Ruania albidiflava]